MDDNQAGIFANSLKAHKVQKPVSLYSESKGNYQNVTTEYDLQGVLLNVSKQIKAFQNADNISKAGSSRKHLEEYKTNNFLPISMMSSTHQPEQIQSKFETQCELDTQLMDIMENAEALIDIPKEMSQEFDNSFSNLDVGNKQAVKDNVVDEERKQEIERLEFNEKTATVTNSNDLEVENILHTETNSLKHIVSKSPILNSSPLLKPKTQSPLVYRLESFEKFESIALSVIKDNPDFEVAKRVINSQIINNELFIQTHAEPVLGDRDKTISPVLKISKTKHRDDSLVEDKILFSSDDEDFANVQELPLTCALETSFYNQSDVLDKTMFVGFQTASNKSIQVNTDSYSKAKSILDNVKSQEYISLMKLVEVIDSNSKINNNVIESEKCAQNIDHFDKEVEKGVNVPDGTKSERVFKELESNSELLNNLENNNIQLENALKLSAKDRELKAPSLISNEDKEAFKNRFLEDKYEVSNEVAPSSENMDIDECLMKEFENNFIAENDCREIKDALDDNVISDNNNVAVDKESGAFRPNVGFKTANNKGITISEQGLAKTRKIFEDIDFNDSEENSNFNEKNQNRNIYIDTSKDFIGFRTANNEEIKVSESALAKTKNIFDNIDNDDIFPTHKNITDKISGDKHKTETIVNKNNFTHSKNKCNNFINPLPKLKIENIQLPTNTSPKLYKDPNILDNKQIPKLVSFKTASNKEVKISSEALAKTKKILSDVMCDQNEGKEDGSNNNRKILEEVQSTKPLDFTFKENTNVATKRNKITKAPNVAQESLPLALDVGFKTASNKPVKISEQALERSKKIFQDITDPMRDDQSNQLNDKMQGFETASNRPIAIKDETLARTKNIFKDIFSNNDKDNKDDENINTSPLGFGTASDKSATISDDTLIKSKKVFEEFEVCHKDTNKSFVSNNYCGKPIFEGFKTASNKVVNISASALAKCKKIFEDLDKDITNESSKENEGSAFVINKKTNINTVRDINKPIFEGFKTANNKRVKISEEALIKSKNVFKDLDKDIVDSENLFINENNPFINNKELNLDVVKHINNPIFEGFKTANNKSVKISEEALAKSRKLLQDLDKDFKDNHITETDLDTIKDSNKNVFEGFKTANNKTVKISEEAIAKSKKLFQDIDTVNEDENGSGNKENAFAGFQTANNKPVEVSKETLLKTKQIFEGFDLSQRNFDDFTTNIKERSKDKVFRFQTANNNDVKVSEDSLKFTKQLFSDIDSEINKKPLKVNVKSNDDYNLNLDELINTEVIKNLEESLHTEDFYKTSPVSKRSGSPILSCPKAKKRRIFKTPQSTNKTNSICDTKTIAPANAHKFSENYKKIKKYTLKDIEVLKSSNPKEIDPYISNFTFDTLLDFEFGGKRNDIDTDVWSTDKVQKCFTDSINKKIVPEGWIANHLKLILWKLLSYEIYFPNCMENVCTVRNVLDQLKYRYDRELYNVERPALRKILEKDEVPSKLMVLCVAGLYVDGVCVTGVTNQQNIELLLTDGWYCVKACGDRMIDKLVAESKIRIGTKLAIHGAELMNCEQGVAPWEDTSSVRLKISGNASRRARWHARLGYHGNGAVASQLRAVRAEGGRVPRLRVFVARLYPPLYVEKFDDGSTATKQSPNMSWSFDCFAVTRSERLEHLQQAQHEAERQNQVEKLYDELERSAEQESQDSEGLDSDKGLETGSQLYRHMKKCKDTSEFKVTLTRSQMSRLQEHAMKKRDRLVQDLQTRVQELVRKRGLDAARNVVPLLKMRVADVRGDCVSKAMVTIWRPNECLLDLLTEGAWIDAYNVVPTGVRFSELQISAGRQSIFQPSKLNKDKFKKYTDNLKRKCYPIKDLLHTTTTDYNEIDTIGLIFLIEPSTNQFQNIYLADENKNIVSVNFWGGIKKFGYENILDTGQIVACLNLQKRAGNTGRVPQYRATELTHFTRTCKIDSIRKSTEELSAKFQSIDKRKFINDCVAIRNNLTNVRYGNTENVTPYRLNNSDYNITKNKLFIDSPVGKLDTNLNLSGLDFESTFKQTDTQDLSPERLLRKRKVNERIAKLKMYGEPPPLSSIHIINKSNAIKPYKSPLLQNDSLSVASDKKLPENSAKSPVLNRTYVKMNPVKLNFCDDGNSDPFAEEFDCSPPLSLE